MDKNRRCCSYGSSGGASIDASGKVVGITSNSHSDTLGSLGYIINITSLNNWVGSNKNKSAQASSLADKAIDLARTANNFKTGNEFYLPYLGVTLIKPSDWNITYEDETVVLIDKSSDGEGGAILVGKTPFPFKADT